MVPAVPIRSISSPRRALSAQAHPIKALGLGVGAKSYIHRMRASEHIVARADRLMGGTDRLRWHRSAPWVWSTDCIIEKVDTATARLGGTSGVGLRQQAPVVAVVPLPTFVALICPEIQKAAHIAPSKSPELWDTSLRFIKLLV